MKNLITIKMLFVLCLIISTGCESSESTANLNTKKSNTNEENKSKNPEHKPNNENKIVPVSNDKADSGDNDTAKKMPATKAAARKDKIKIDQKWATLTGRFVIKGIKLPAPKPAALVIPAGVACGPGPFLKNSFLIGKKGGLKNVMIYCEDPAAIHKSYKAIEKDKVEVDNTACRFVPHVQKIWNKQTMVFKNSDKMAHACNLTGFNIAPVAVIIPAGKSINRNFTAVERTPASLQCGIHPWMKGYVAIRPDPYIDISTKDGSFIIKNLPVGKQKFRLWHEKFGYLSIIEIPKRKEDMKNRKGQYTFDLKAGVTDLGDIVLDLNEKKYKDKLK